MNTPHTPSHEFIAAVNATRHQLNGMCAALAAGRDDQDAEACDENAVRLEAIQLPNMNSVRGNRHLDATFTWDDLCLVTAGFLRACADFIDQPKQDVPPERLRA